PDDLNFGTDTHSWALPGRAKNTPYLSASKSDAQRRQQFLYSGVHLSLGAEGKPPNIVPTADAGDRPFLQKRQNSVTLHCWCEVGRASKPDLGSDGVGRPSSNESHPSLAEMGSEDFRRSLRISPGSR